MLIWSLIVVNIMTSYYKVLTKMDSWQFMKEKIGFLCNLIRINISRKTRIKCKLVHIL